MFTEEKKEMIAHIRSHNKVLTQEYLEGLRIPELLAEVHPAYREFYTNKINNSKRI